MDFIVAKELTKRNIFFLSIKIISTCLIAGAIGLEIYNLYWAMNRKEALFLPQPIFWIERFALFSHFIEASIAAGYLQRRNRSLFPYVIYVFFVGTVGLFEVFTLNDD